MNQWIIVIKGVLSAVIVFLGAPMAQGASGFMPTSAASAAEVSGAAESSVLSPQSSSASRQAAEWLAKGQSEAKNGKIRAATEAYVQAIRLKPDFAAAYVALGKINHEAGRPDKAIALYRLALQHDPDLMDAYQGLGNLHFDQNRLEEALGFYQEMTKRAPQSPVGYNSVGNCYYGLQKFQEALEMWQKAIDLDPSYPRAYFNRAVLYDGVHDKAKAIENYRKFAELAGAEHAMLVEDARMRIDELEKPDSTAQAAEPEAPGQGNEGHSHH